MFDTMMLWVTRSSPFNLRTRRRLQELGHQALTVPVLNIRALELTMTAEPDALAFTSVHAVRLHKRRRSWTARPVFAVGDETAELAGAVGYRNVRSANGDVDDLRSLILKSLRPDQHLVHLSARDAAGDLVGDLIRAGLSAERSIVYEAIEAVPDQLRTVEEALPHIGGIVVHSPRAAAVVARLIAAPRWYGAVFCLSQACAAKLEGLPGLLVEAAQHPSEASLMRLLWQYKRLSRTTSLAAPQPAQWSGSSAAGGFGVRAIAGGVRAIPAAANSEEGPEDPPPEAA